MKANCFFLCLEILHVKVSPFVTCNQKNDDHSITNHIHIYMQKITLASRYSIFLSSLVIFSLSTARRPRQDISEDMSKKKQNCQ